MNQTTSVLFDAPGPKTLRNFRIVNIVAILALAAVAVWVVVAMAGKGQLTAEKWTPFISGDVWLYNILPGLQATLTAAVVSIVFACVFGAVFGYGRLSHVRLISWFSGVVVEFFRAVPVLLMMIFAWQAYAVTKLFPPDQIALAAVVTGLTLYNGSVFAELLRSGVGSLPSGQREAGWAIGLTRTQTLVSVLIPQGLLAMLPALVGQLVVVLKDSALGYLVTYPELLRQAERIGSAYGNVVPAIIVIAVIFIALNMLLSEGAMRLAERLRSRTAAVVRVQVPGGMVHATADEPVGPDETIPLTREEAGLITLDPDRLELEEEYRRTRDQAEEELDAAARAAKAERKRRKAAKRAGREALEAEWAKRHNGDEGEDR